MDIGINAPWSMPRKRPAGRASFSKWADIVFRKSPIEKAIAATKATRPIAVASRRARDLDSLGCTILRSGKLRVTARWIQAESLEGGVRVRVRVRLGE